MYILLYGRYRKQTLLVHVNSNTKYQVLRCPRCVYSAFFILPVQQYCIFYGYDTVCMYVRSIISIYSLDLCDAHSQNAISRPLTRAMDLRTGSQNMKESTQISVDLLSPPCYHAAHTSISHTLTTKCCARNSSQYTHLQRGQNRARSFPPWLELELTREQQVSADVLVQSADKLLSSPASVTQQRRQFERGAHGIICSNNTQGLLVSLTRLFVCRIKLHDAVLSITFKHS